MTIQQFIETAIKGGWHKDANHKIEGGEIVFLRTKDDAITGILPFSTALLDPTLWQAVGKELGWDTGTEGTPFYGRMYRAKQHDFLDSLQEGKSLEEAVNDATS